MTWQIRQGDVREQLRLLPDEMFHAVCTSPPFWQQRSYLPKGHPDKSKEIGSERSIEEYLATMVEVFREVRRVLRSDGVCFIEIGDSFSSGGRVSHGTREGYKQETNRGSVEVGRAPMPDNRKPLDLCNIPHRLGEALCQDGWCWRSTIVWARPNPMPESIRGWSYERHRFKVQAGVRSRQGDPSEEAGWESHGEEMQSTALWEDCPGCEKCTPHEGYVLRKGSWRPTQAHTFVLMLAKSQDYFCDQIAVLEKAAENPHQRGLSQNKREEGTGIRANKSFEQSRPRLVSTRNPRSVWTILTEPTPFAHYATMPTELIRRLLLAATSQKGCCQSCGAPWVRIVDRPASLPVEDYSGEWFEADKQSASRRMLGNVHARRKAGGSHDNPFPPPETKGWLPTCGCHAPVVPMCVLDPFSGAGSTLLTADRLGLDAIGIELNQDYITIARDRLQKESPLFTQEG
jgi:DNA modification methylase